MADWIVDVIIGLIEGLTEFLPISSTGHLVITRALLDPEGSIGFRQLIVVQGAAILAVCWEYRRRLWDIGTTLMSDRQSRLFAFNLFLAFLPAAVAGLAFEDTIRNVLFAPIPVALALVIGGVLILWAERRTHVERVTSIEQLQPLDAFKVGLFQMLALVPGTSRSAATILGGLLTGLSRKTAAEFSFFVAIPVMFAATGYKLLDSREPITVDEARSILLSSVVAFFAALIAIRFLIRYVSQHSFAIFAWYRIVFGGFILISWQFGWVSWGSG
jgi:undecaprenyl-diphosphatase